MAGFFPPVPPQLPAGAAPDPYAQAMQYVDAAQDAQQDAEED